MALARLPHISIDQYLERERRSDDKHEYLDGMAYMMAGASERHVTIVSNAVITLGTQLLRRLCKTYSSDMRVETPSGLVAYPDVIVVCGKPELRDNKGDVLLNPTVIIEVLSPTTANFDRTLKFEHYRSLPSLQEYVMITQNERQIEHHLRQPNDTWVVTRMAHLDAVLKLPSIDCTLAVADVYAKV
jgi:Uma2 family endonuclease